MRTIHALSLVALSTLIVAVPAEALATKTFLDLRIPASACRPREADKAKVKLSSGAWVFESAESGRATLFCPVHIAYASDGPDSTNIQTFRLWYRDPDGATTGAHVNAKLMRRKFDASTDSAISGAAITSDSYSDSVYQRVEVSVGHTADFFQYSYHVEVEIARSSVEVANPVFIGVDFTNAVM